MRSLTALRVALATSLLMLAACPKDRAEVKPTETATPTPQAPSSASSAATAVTAPNAKVPFAIVARGDTKLKVFNAGSTLLVSVGRLFFRLDPTGIHQDPDLGRGLQRYYSRIAIFGAWPDAMLDVEDDYDAGNEIYAHHVFKRVNNRWTESLQGTLRGDILTGFFDWKDGRGVGVVLKQKALDYRLELLVGKGPIALPSMQSAEGGGGDPDAPACATKVIPSGATLGFATGQAFIVGNECTQKQDGRAVVERWDTERKSTIDALEPDRGKGTWSIAGASPTDVWALRRDEIASPRMVHFDGKAWNDVVLPDGSVTADVALGADGAPWVAVGDHVKMRVGTGWEDLPLPKLGEGAKAAVRQIVTTKEAVYMVVDAGGRYMILGPTAPKEVVVLPTLAETEATPLGPGTQGFEVATTACASIVVPLLVNVTEKQKFPVVEAALTGATGLDGMELVIDDWGGGKMLVAKTPSLAMAKIVAEKMKEKNAATIAKPLCHNVNAKATVTLGQ